MKIRAIKDHILCTDGDLGDTVLDSGLIIKGNTNKSEGITARWFKVFAVGPDVWEGITPGVWVLVSYGRWTDGMEVEDERFPKGKDRVWRVELESCLAASEEKPASALYYNSDVATAEKKER